MAKNVHLTRRDQLKTETGIQIRTDDPVTPVEAQPWVNTADEKFRLQLGGITKEVAFIGDSAGQTLYSTTVSSTAQLLAAASSNLTETIYLRAGVYDLRTISTPGIAIQKSLRLIGEKTGGNSASSRTKIITDVTRNINAAPSSTTITNNNTVSVINNSNVVNLVSGTWSSDLSNQFLIINGIYYEILSNPTSTQILLKRAYTGLTNGSVSYYITPMLNSVIFENIEFVAADGTHNSVNFRNVIKPILLNCNLNTDNDDTIYGKVNVQYCFDAIVHLNSFKNFKIDILNNNYNSMIVDNNFVSTTIMGTDACIQINTNAGVASLNTESAVSRNIFAGPAPCLDIKDASNNNFSDNIINDVFNKGIALNSNCFDNIINGNRITGVAGGLTLIEINGDYNIVNGNRLTKTTGFAINFSATAASNTAIGNRYTGGAVINDTISANLNRIEDDFARFGSVPTGSSKDFIDKINEVLVTLQNTPSGLVQHLSAINSGVINESVVYWNTIPAEYRTADGADSSKFAAVGFAKKISSTIADVYTNGFIQLTNSGNPLNTNLFNSSYIGQRFYLGVSGNLIPESTIFTTSGTVFGPKVVGTLIDVQGGGAVSQFFIGINEDFKYGTPSSFFSIGSSGSVEKSIVAVGVAGNLDKITYNPSSRSWFTVKDASSGEITQPFNRILMGNSVIDYSGGTLLSATSGSVTVNPHSVLTQGYKKSTGSSSVSPFTSYSGNAYIYNHLTSGVISSTGFVDAALLGVIYNSGSVFADTTLVSAKQYGSMQQVVSALTPAVSGYIDAAKVYVPFKSGSVDVNISASSQGSCTLQTLFPYQVARMKLQLNGSDITGSEKINSLYYVSGSVVYTELAEDIITTITSTSGAVNEIKLQIAYDIGGSTAPVNFTNINLNVKSL